VDGRGGQWSCPLRDDGEVFVDDLVTRSRPPVRQARADRRAERRRLARCDALSSRLAELHSVRALLAQAAEVVSAGWVQGGWFTVGTPTGEVVVTAYDLRLVDTYPVTGACLVGGVIYAAGGPEYARTQLVQRTLDVTWHAMREDVDLPVVVCPSPQVRTTYLLDLTRWNDARGRTRAEVVDLLGSARHLAEVHSDACRAERLALHGA
jgi:hypothetical protein